MLPGRVSGPSFSGFWPLALIVAPRPSRVSGLVTTTCSSYVPAQTITVPPTLTAAMAVLTSRYLAVLHEVSAPLFFAEWDT